jgi:hypothetical protein
LSYTNLSAASETLRLLIEQDMQRDVGLNGLANLFDSGHVISLSTPHEMQGTAQGVSLWLYRVVRDENRLNDPPTLRSAPDGTVVVIPAPLPLQLHYLVTPLTNDSPDTEQKILGRVLQLFHSQPVVTGDALQEDLAGTEAELHVRLESLSLDELTRVWDALEGSYRLSVSYQVTIANIESASQPLRASVVESVDPQYAQILQAERR